MKAIRTHAKGGAEQLVYEDAPTPAPGDGQALVRVYAAGITPTELDWNETYKHADGSPRLPSIPGHDVSGTVEALGPGATGASVGDAVYGLIDFPFDGSCAEYVVAPANELAAKPRTLDHTTAAAVPLSSLTAWQALFTHAKLRPGQRVLVHGAAGGVGAFAVQLAHAAGAHVVTTSSARHFDFLRGLGADEVIDYAAEHFEDKVHDADVVLDTLGGDVQARSWQTLCAGGLLIALNAPVPNPLPRPDVRGLFFIVRPDRAGLADIARRIDAGHLRVFVEGVYPLADARQAFERGRSGHARGKLVLRVADQP